MNYWCPGSLILASRTSVKHRAIPRRKVSINCRRTGGERWKTIPRGCDRIRSRIAKFMERYCSVGRVWLVNWILHRRDSWELSLNSRVVTQTKFFFGAIDKNLSRGWKGSSSLLSKKKVPFLFIKSVCVVQISLTIDMITWKKVCRKFWEDFYGKVSNDNRIQENSAFITDINIAVLRNSD